MPTDSDSSDGSVDEAKAQDTVQAGVKATDEAQDTQDSQEAPRTDTPDITDLTSAIEQVSLSDKADVTQVAAWLKQGVVLVLSGAGVSVAAGIPDFRTPGTGLYDNLHTYNLPFPEAVFDLEFYARNPKPFCRLAQDLWPTLFVPTLTHCFVALLQKHGLLLRNYSQNIDGLEHRAGLTEAYLIECHGHFRTASCIQCKRPADADVVKESILEQGMPPACSKCKRPRNWIKPDIVFFGEGLPSKFHQHLDKDCSKAKVCLVLGTSLQVMPVAGIPDWVGPDCKRVLINREDVGNSMDVFLQGDCDNVILELAESMGWKSELVEMHARIRGEIESKTVKKE
jgi:NAD-dependent SIR2 family protein deacetylase